MQENGYESLDGFRGLLSQKNISKPNLYERAQFMKYFSDFNQSGT
jgi:dihydroorotate dehydrogenase (fumarate)